MLFSFTVCPYGYYGNDCKGVCDCADGCGCHPVTGHCHLPPALPTVWQGIYITVFCFGIKERLIRASFINCM